MLSRAACVKLIRLFAEQRMYEMNYGFFVIAVNFRRFSRFRVVQNKAVRIRPTDSIHTFKDTYT